MKFVKFTKQGGGEIYVNVAQIVSVSRLSVTTLLLLTNGQVVITDTIEEVVNVLGFERRE